MSASFADDRAFHYQGTLPYSKSQLNRLLILDSFFPTAHEAVYGQSLCEDVRDMENAVRSFRQGQTEFWCGEAGTVLRFLALRVSRQPGTFLLKASPKLFLRPQNALKDILQSLGVLLTFGKDFLKIQGPGWTAPSHGFVAVDQSQSSQFGTALMLSAWNLPFDLRLKFSKERLSESYLQMTQNLLKRFSVQSVTSADEFFVPHSQLPRWPSQIILERDMSCAFTVAALAAIAGSCYLTDIDLEASEQPDSIFPTILQDMGIAIDWDRNSLSLAPQAFDLESVDLSLKNCPDLFPVLAVLCAFANGNSFLRQAPHLVHKESNRLEKIKELLSLVGRKLQIHGHDIEIVGQPLGDSRGESITFDATGDHRLVMAATLLLYMGFPIKILGKDSLKKSFPEWMNIAKRLKEF